MDPHPDFAQTNLPRTAAVDRFELAPLDLTVVAEDFSAVTRAEVMLKGLFGDDWPSGLTLEGNAIDLAWHDREFTSRRSFAWIIRESGTYLGCAYVSPDLGRRGTGTIITWIGDHPDRAPLIKAFNAAFKDWITPYLPTGADYRWRSSPEHAPDRGM